MFQGHGTQRSRQALVDCSVCGFNVGSSFTYSSRSLKSTMICANRRHSDDLRVVRIAPSRTIGTTRQSVCMIFQVSGTAEQACNHSTVPCTAMPPSVQTSTQISHRLAVCKIANYPTLTACSGTRVRRRPRRKSWSDHSHKDLLVIRRGQKQTEEGRQKSSVTGLSAVFWLWKDAVCSSIASAGISRITALENEHIHDYCT